MSPLGSRPFVQKDTQDLAAIFAVHVDMLMDAGSVKRSPPTSLLSMPLPDTTPSSPLSVLIVGGGLSGLTAAHELSRHPPSIIAWHLIESQPHLGGRIKNAQRIIDMGAAWIWPSQRKIHEMVRSLGASTIRQDDADDGRVRIRNGAACMIDGLADGLDRDRITLSAAAVSIERMDDDRIRVGIRHNNSREHVVFVYTRRLVWTAPPRMALPPRVRWDPPLSDVKTTAMRECNTWMASVTKLSFLYDKKYWNVDWILNMKRGMYILHDTLEPFDLYDACIEEDGLYAFTLFALIKNWNCNTRQKEDDNEATTVHRIMDQLQSIASSKQMTLSNNDDNGTTNYYSWMTQYKSYAIQHWPQVTSISDNPKPTSVGMHPRPNPILSQSEWKTSGRGVGEGHGMVFFAGTESDLYSPGLMEGAVESAHRAVEEVKRTLGV